MARHLLVAILTLATLHAVAEAPAHAATLPDDLVTLGTLMTGSFSSAKQAAADPEFRDVRLHAARIWTERSDAFWIYLEQAMAETLDKPYRQRVYRLTRQGDGSFESAVFELAGDPLAVAGAWKSPGTFPIDDPSKLVRRPGCSVILAKRSGELYEGSTVGTECVSAHRGAAYATSEVVLRPRSLTSWDRGFDASGTQVWGATKGAYVFDRVTD